MTALVTPFKNQKIDEVSFEKLIKRQIKNGIDVVVPVGTTGESATLTHDEHRICIEIAVDACKGTNVKVLAGAGSNATHEAIDIAKFAQAHGAHGILSVAPYYNKPTQEGIYRHYRTLAESTDTSIILYNVPGRTGVNIKSETTLRLATDCPNIIGIKEASGNVDQVRAIVLEKPDPFIVLSGDDHLSLSFIKEGAEGVISVIGNAYPELFSRLIHLCLENRFEEAETIQQRLEGMYYLMFVDGNPAGIKELLYQKGLIRHNILRLPLVSASDSTSTLIARVRNQIEQR